MQEDPKTLDEFRDELRHHDWTYSWSDDPRVWRAGEAASARLKSIADRHNDDWKRAYNTEFAREFHREPFAKPYTFPYGKIEPLTEEKSGGAETSQEEASPSV